jgi:hypothetical protein
MKMKEKVRILKETAASRILQFKNYFLKQKIN